MTTRASVCVTVSDLTGYVIHAIPWECPEPGCGKECSARGAVVAHVQTTASKRLMTYPVALASILHLTDRWQYDTFQRTWSQRNIFCSCPRQSPRPPLPIQSPAQLATDTSPPPAPANVLPTLERVPCTPVVTMTHIPKPLRSEVAVAWASLAQKAGNVGVVLIRRAYTRAMCPPTACLCPRQQSPATS
jgi:hypothetical protein